MSKISDGMVINIIQDMNLAISVMRSVGKWFEESGKIPSKWWKLENLNPEFLLKYAKPQEFFVALVNEKPAAAAILQFSQNSQDWESIDKDRSQKALYIHWLCVDHEFSGKNLPKAMIDFAGKMARENHINLLRVDTNANEMKLRKIYEKLGFSLVAVEKENYRQTAFYQKR